MKWTLRKPGLMQTDMQEIASPLKHIPTQKKEARIHTHTHTHVSLYALHAHKKS
jgi:hypothetical protein